MDFVMTFACVALFILIAAIVAYANNSNSIIKMQEKQIASLRKENKRLQATLYQVSRRKEPKVIEIHDNRIDPENVPDFGNI